MPSLITQETVKPPLKWAGGKRWLTPQLLNYWQSHLQQFPHARLVEPFSGGLSVALGITPKRALLNDINPHVIAFYKNLQQGFKINTKKISLINDAETYYQNREQLNNLILNNKIDSVEASALFYYLNRTGYNGLCRFNQKGLFNVPFGRYKTINYQTDFSKYQKLFQQWQFQCNDFESLEITSGDFIYADPPYDVPFVSYAQNGFQWEDQIRLVKWLIKQPGTVITSNQATDRIIKLYQENSFAIEVIDAPRRIACNGNRQTAKEMLAILRPLS